MEVDFLRNQHVKFFKRCLLMLPNGLRSLDTSRLTVVYFAISGLDLLNALDEIESERELIIDWIYSLQLLPDLNGSNLNRCGFRGSNAIGNSLIVKKPGNINNYDSAHIAMTYTGLASLIILGDDLSRVNRLALIEGVRALQQPDGSFCPVIDESENDMRFVYCAACICYILQDWSAMNIPKVIEYIQKSVTYEGGIAQGPGLEAHGGPTFCAVATLSLMGKLTVALNSNQLAKLRRWCIFRQEGGFQGRPNKPADTCYSFWIGATLKILDSYSFVNEEENMKFILSTQDPITGGMAKWPDTIPDPLHTYMGISGMSLMDIEGLIPVYPALNISLRATKHLYNIHEQWKSADR
ncbi:geranylgeranyl transferase type-1 subunit beta-like [Centruroides sculpturatus]|uniref:geranylgeranyl transferase type-1 subunit beta-like n=1 Tax=Centruroides sculpturatus TaxID=218467 RepID=UPI000C6D975A|nr:geranylgeranyl transferase type-1 subunit beta-like [Centruroides sculpturatus]